MYISFYCDEIWIIIFSNYHKEHYLQNFFIFISISWKKIEILKHWKISYTLTYPHNLKNLIEMNRLDFDRFYYNWYFKIRAIEE